MQEEKYFPSELTSELRGLQILSGIDVPKYIILILFCKLLDYMFKTVI
jgi:hypothetical protein